MRAIILAGGKGTRLRPYTTTLPKPLVPVGERAILDIVLAQLKQNGITEVTMAVNHMAHLIMAYFGNGDRWGLRITYSVEDKPLSTIAPLKLIRDLPETFIVMNGDVLTDLDFQDLIQSHHSSAADITVASYDRSAKIDFGVLGADSDNLIVSFQEKPVYEFRVSMGVYVLNRRLLEIVPDDQAFGFDDLMLACIKRKRKALSYLHKGSWLDIGRPSDYDEANEQSENLLRAILGGKG